MVSSEGMSAHISHARINFASGFAVFDQIVGEANFAQFEKGDEARAAEAEVAFFVAFRDR